MRMSPIQNNSPPCRSSKTSQIQRKFWINHYDADGSLFLHQNWSCGYFFSHLSIVGWSSLSGTPQFVCIKSSEKFEKRKIEDELLFTMTTRSLTHRLKQVPFWPAKTSHWWVIRRTANDDIFFAALWLFSSVRFAVCCGVRGRALASHTDVCCWQL